MNNLTAWFNIPTETLLMPMPDVDDFPTDDALRFGRFRVPLRSFGDLGLAVAPLLKPSVTKYLISSTFKRAVKDENTSI